MTRFAVTGALLIDGAGSAPQPDSTVIWEENRIVWVGPDRDADLGNAEEIPAVGGAVLPGLIDAHVHLCLDGTIEGVDGVGAEPIDQVRDRAMGAARRLLGVGITTARDQGSRDGVAIEVAAAQRRGDLVGARVLAAGRGITRTGGHGWMIGVEADGPDGVRAAVVTEAERGADIIKLFPTGGVLGSGAHGFQVVMTAEEVAAATEEAHARGLLVGAHTHGPEGIDLVLDGGVDTIEHATGITPDQARRAADAGVAIVPTLTATEVILGHLDALPEDLRERVAEVSALQESGIRAAIEAGATVLAGTDAGTPFNPPGLLLTEMKILARLGLGTEGALAAATGATATALRLDGIGVIGVGMVADLLVVEGDPTLDLETLAEPRVVVQDGRVR